MKYITAILIFVFIPCTIFAAGRAEADRDTNTATIEGSQFVNPAMVDAYEYINDYVFPYETDTTGDLSVFVNLEKKQVLSIGDNFNLLIGLKVNDQRYFTRNEGNFILFIHNPNVLQQTAWRNAIIAALQSIRAAQRSGAILGIFNAAANKIIEVPDNIAIADALNQIQSAGKINTIDTILDQSFKCMEAIDNDYNTRFFWITDSGLLQSNNAAREQEYFDFILKLHSRNNISISYLGYGEASNWAATNQSIKNTGGNIYFIHSAEELEEEIWGDYDRFVYPAIRNIKVQVSFMPWITENKYDYRNEWYPVANFTPVNADYTLARSNNIYTMGVEDHRIFLYYLGIGAENTAAANQYYREISSDRIVPVGFVSLEYYSYNEEKTIYRVYPLQVTYTDDYDSYSAQIDQSVRKYTILQNTAWILKELSNLVNQRQYYTAILLVDSQIKLLESFLEREPDSEISGAIITLNGNKALLMEQARSLQYIR